MFSPTVLSLMPGMDCTVYIVKDAPSFCSAEDGTQDFEHARPVAFSYLYECLLTCMSVYMCECVQSSQRPEESAGNPGNRVNR